MCNTLKIKFNRYTKSQLYADDTVIYINDSYHLSDATDLLNTDLNTLAKWCAGNKLTINSKKTKTMNFADKCSLKKYTHKSILINNEIIELTQTYKFLTVVLRLLNIFLTL